MDSSIVDFVVCIGGGYGYNGDFEFKRRNTASGI